MRLFFFYLQTSDIGETHSLAPTTVPIRFCTLFSTEVIYCRHKRSQWTVAYTNRVSAGKSCCPLIVSLLSSRVLPFVQKKVNQPRYTPWRRLGGERRYSSYSFTTSALDGGEWSASRPDRAFTPGERTPGTHCTGGWVDPRAGLDTEDRGKILSSLPGIEPRSPGRPARS
jgi:hypothetical protein